MITGEEWLEIDRERCEKIFTLEQRVGELEEDMLEYLQTNISLERDNIELRKTLEEIVKLNRYSGDEMWIIADEALNQSLPPTSLKEKVRNAWTADKVSIEPMEEFENMPRT